MTQLFNKITEKQKRRDLRNNMPKAEVLVWTRLQGSQTGCRFRRQFSVGPFVIDFYCPSLRLAVEIDGDSHFEKAAQAADEERQAFIEALGIKLLRFTNNEVFNNLDSVVEAIGHTALSLAGSRPLRPEHGGSSGPQGQEMQQTPEPPTVPLGKGDI